MSEKKIVGILPSYYVHVLDLVSWGSMPRGDYMPNGPERPLMNIGHEHESACH